MAIYASGKTVPQLDSISAVADNGLVIVHNDIGLKKITVSDFRSAMASNVNNKLEAEIERARQAEKVNADKIAINASSITSLNEALQSETSRAQEAEKVNTTGIKTNATAIEEIKSHTATASSDGLMSSADKAKLD